MFRLRWLATLAVLLLCATAWSGPGAAAGAGLPGDLAAFADPIITAQMARRHIPGAVLVVVRDGRVIYAKGYGYADLERQIPWDPERTVFRAKSLSKLITATAALQLSERGQLALDADVNRYLAAGPYQVPLTFPHPVTAAHLLTHTAGFADMGVATNVRAAGDLLSLGEYLALDHYRRLEPPGRQIRYGDHGYVLLGYLVETIAGRPFPEYVAQEIFAPLQMDRSSFAQPWPGELAREMATGYVYLAGRYLPQRAGYIQVYPASGMITTASDMARFMLAQLEGGWLEGGQLLQPGTLAEMQRQQFTQHPRLPGLTYGFWEQFTHGRRALWHAGEGLGFATWLYLLPAERTGIFIATNRREFGLHEAFTEAFLDRYFPGESAPPPQPLPGYRERAARYAGVYTFLRYDPTTLEKVNQEEAMIRANPDGTLAASFAPGRWVEVAPLLFQRQEGEGMLAFRMNTRGEMTALLTDHWPWVFARGHWYDAAGFRLPLLAGSVLLFLSALLTWPVAGWRRVRVGDLAGVARLVGVVTSGLNLAFVAMLTPTLLLTMQGGDIPVLYGLSPALRAALLIPLVTAPLAGLLLVWAALAWRRRYWSLAGRMHYTLVALGAAAFTWSMAYLNLMGW